MYNFELLPRKTRHDLHRQLTNLGLVRSTATQKETKEVFDKFSKYFDGEKIVFPEHGEDAYGNPRNEWVDGMTPDGIAVKIFSTEKGTIYWGEDSASMPFFITFSRNNFYFEEELSITYRRSTIRTAKQKVNEFLEPLTKNKKHEI